MFRGPPDAAMYSGAIQNIINLNVPDLQDAEYIKNKMGNPFSNGGNNARVYKLKNNSGFWAVRCFLSYDESQRVRYQKLSQFFKEKGIDKKYFMKFRYYHEGIRVGGKFYPVITMQWIEGLTLDRYISMHYRDGRRINVLLINFLRMLAFLRHHNVAHGDLQHGNIMVLGDRLHLVDYDGMYIPEFAGMKRVELGLDDYQHPRRSFDVFTKDIDNFSAWVIFASLAGVMLEPQWWEPSLSDIRDGGGRDHLLFCREDYIRPDNSAILKKYLKSNRPQLRMLGELLRSFIISPHNIPSPADYKMPIFNEDGSWVTQFLSDMAEPHSLRMTSESYATYEAVPGFFDKSVNAMNNMLATNRVTSTPPATSLGSQRGIEEALRMYDRAVSQGVTASNTKTDASRGADKLYSEGCRLVDDGDYFSAISTLQQSITLRPNHPESHNMLGIAFANVKFYDKALDHFQKAIGLKIDYAEAYYNIGELVRLKQKRKRNSISYYQTAIKYKPDYFKALWSLGKTYNSLKEYDESIRYLEEALKYAPNSYYREKVRKNLDVARSWHTYP